MKKREGISFELKIMCFMISFEILYFLIMIATRSFFLNAYMVNDFYDSEMDFFNMLALAGGADPYRELANYPAMCFFILKFFHRMIPGEMLENEDIVSGKYLRNYMPVQLAYTVLIMAIVISSFMIFKKFYKESEKEKNVLAIALVFSGPMVFAIERGNLILISFVFSLIYIALYDHNKKYCRIIAYVALAMAASIKMYPALLGILTLGKKRYKETALLIAFGLIAFILPFFYFDGIASIRSLLQGITASTDLQGNFGTGYNFSAANFVRIFGLIFNIDVTTRMLTGVKIGSLILSIVMYITANEEWKRVFAIVSIIIWLPEFSYTYTLIFLILPFVVLMNCELKNKIEKICLCILGASLLPYALPVLGRIDTTNPKFPLTAPTLLINVMILSVAILILVDNVICHLKERV